MTATSFRHDPADGVSGLASHGRARGALLPRARPGRGGSISLPPGGRTARSRVRWLRFSCRSFGHLGGGNLFNRREAKP